MREQTQNPLSAYFGAPKLYSKGFQRGNFGQLLLCRKKVDNHFQMTPKGLGTTT